MDDIVRQAMAKWPNVPAVFGWLSLDRRGHWLLKDERIGNPLLDAFIGRNYDHDDEGRWFFQNGPQRVFVRLSYAPWVLRIDDDDGFVTHTGLRVRRVDGAWLDEDGIAIVRTEHGPGTLDDRDGDALAARLVDAAGNCPDEDRLLQMIESIAAGVESGLHLLYAGRRVPLHPTTSRDVPRQLGFVRDPGPDDVQTEIER